MRRLSPGRRPSVGRRPQSASARWRCTGGISPCRQALVARSSRPLPCDSSPGAAALLPWPLAKKKQHAHKQNWRAKFCAITLSNARAGRVPCLCPRLSPCERRAGRAAGLGVRACCSRATLATGASRFQLLPNPWHALVLARWPVPARPPAGQRLRVPTGALAAALRAGERAAAPAQPAVASGIALASERAGERERDRKTLTLWCTPLPPESGLELRTEPQAPRQATATAILKVSRSLSLSASAENKPARGGAVFSAPSSDTLSAPKAACASRRRLVSSLSNSNQKGERKSLLPVS